MDWDRTEWILTGIGVILLVAGFVLSVIRVSPGLAALTIVIGIGVGWFVRWHNKKRTAQVVGDTDPASHA